jgi:Protein of unknown function (DUF3179)
MVRSSARVRITRRIAVASGFASGFAWPAAFAQAPARWRKDWPRTDFSRTSVALSEILDAGPGRDGIPAIAAPGYVPIDQTYLLRLADTEPLIVLKVGGDVRLYPLRIMTRHEIVNDTVGGAPILVTYCPLCNSAVAFERRVAGGSPLFGVTGKLRNSNLIMYDLESESWWQQFTGDAIVGARAGERLKAIAVHIAPYREARKSFPDARILAPPVTKASAYRNPYVSYDTRRTPYPFAEMKLPANVQPMSYVVAVGARAWPLKLLADVGRIEVGDLLITWAGGMNSALDTAEIGRGRDIGTVRVQQKMDGSYRDVRHEITFAFVFLSFNPDGVLVESKR